MYPYVIVVLLVMIIMGIDVTLWDLMMQRENPIIPELNEE